VAAAKPDIHAYLCNRFKWAPNVINTIDWESFTKIIRQMTQSHTTIVKRIHGIAPTGHIANRNNGTLSAKCPSCECEREDNNHIITCPADSRKEWRQATLRIAKTLQLHRSDPTLKTILLEGLNKFLTQQTEVHETEYPTQYHPLIQEQNALGWDQLYRGRWSNQWSKMHTLYAENRPNWKSHEADGKQWVTIHGRMLLQQWLTLWKIRNAERHGADQQERQRTRYSHLQKELTELYKLRTEVTPRDRNIFYTTATEHMKASPELNTLEDWIFTHRTAIIASAQQAKQHGIQHNRTIREFFKHRNEITDREPPAHAGRLP